MAPEVLRRVVGGPNWQLYPFPPHWPARLWGYRRRAVKGRHYPGVVKVEEKGNEHEVAEFVDGIVVWCQEGDVERMDEWEDYVSGLLGAGMEGKSYDRRWPSDLS